MTKHRRDHDDRGEARAVLNDDFSREANPFFEVALKAMSEASTTPGSVGLSVWQTDRLFEKWFEANKSRRTNVIYAYLCGMIDMR